MNGFERKRREKKKKTKKKCENKTDYHNWSFENILLYVNDGAIV